MTGYGLYRSGGTRAGGLGRICDSIRQRQNRVKKCAGSVTITRIRRLSAVPLQPSDVSNFIWTGTVSLIAVGGWLNA